MTIRRLQKRQVVLYRADDREPVPFTTADLIPAQRGGEQLVAFFYTVRVQEASAQLAAEIDMAVSARRAERLGSRAGIELDSPDDFFGKVYPLDLRRPCHFD